MRFYAQTMSSPSAFKWVDDSILNVHKIVSLHMRYIHDLSFLVAKKNSVNAIKSQFLEWNSIFSPSGLKTVVFSVWSAVRETKICDDSTGL